VIYFYYDHTLWRAAGHDRFFSTLEVYDQGEWKRASGDLFPSEQDYDHMRRISEAEAEKLIAAEGKG
jgi:hypothetical protein